MSVSDYVIYVLIRLNLLIIYNIYICLVVPPRMCDVFRNMDAQAAVLDLLAIPFEKKEDVRMVELMRLAHNFLQHFCRGNHYNQALLHKRLELFLNPGVSELRFDDREEEKQM